MITFKAKTQSGEIIKSAISEFSFPAGEAFIKVEPKRELEKTEIAILTPSAETLHDDLFKLAMWNNYLVRKEYAAIRDGKASEAGTRVLLIPYFPGARADRVSPGTEEPFGIQVYADFIESLKLHQVIVFDPHSPETERQLMYEKLSTVHSDELFASRHAGIYNFKEYSGIIAPDKGAVKRAQGVADAIGIPLFRAEKTRDPNTGKLSGFSVDPLNPEGKYLLVDDICDAGGTFLGLAEATGLSWRNLDLFVSHGVFSRNATETLPEHFGKIFTTNSYNPTRLLPSQFVRFDVIRLMLDEVGD